MRSTRSVFYRMETKFPIERMCLGTFSRRGAVARQHPPLPSAHPRESVFIVYGNKVSMIKKRTSSLTSLFSMLSSVFSAKSFISFCIGKYRILSAALPGKPCKLFSGCLPRQLCDRRRRNGRLHFFNIKMMIRHRRDLRQMCDGDNLVRSA